MSTHWTDASINRLVGRKSAIYSSPSRGASSDRNIGQRATRGLRIRSKQQHLTVDRRWNYVSIDQRYAHIAVQNQRAKRPSSHYTSCLIEEATFNLTNQYPLSSGAILKRLCISIVFFPYAHKTCPHMALLNDTDKKRPKNQTAFNLVARNWVVHDIRSFS